MILKLAWRNIWRNRRRTLITMASVFFAVVLATLLMSIKEGVYSGMMDSVIGTYTGFGQVHAKGYWEEKTLDYSFAADEKLLYEIAQVRGIKSTIPRIEGVAMAASTDITKVAMVVGIDTKAEQANNNLHERVVNGEYLQPTDNAVMLGAGLADYLHVKVNDTIVLLGQGYHGASAAGKYTVKGIIKFASPELSKQLVMMPLVQAQVFYGMEGLVNNLVLNFENPDKAKPVIKDLRGRLGKDYEVMEWQEIMPELDNMIKTDRVEGYVFMFILYMVVSFGIFGTILMMLAERTREFGVLVSIGMKRLKLALIVQLEVVFISVLGALLGMVGALPVCYYFFVRPISLGDDLKKMTEEYGMEAVIRASMEPFIFLEQGVIIFLIACVISLYPFFKLMRLSAIKAVRS